MFISKNKALSLLLIFMGISSLHYQASGARWLSENSEKAEEINLVNAQVQMNSSNSNEDGGFFTASNRQVPSSFDPLHNRVVAGSGAASRPPTELEMLDIMKSKFQVATLDFIGKLEALHETVKRKVGRNATPSAYGDAYVAEATKLRASFLEAVENIRDEMCPRSNTP